MVKGLEEEQELSLIPLCLASLYWTKDLKTGLLSPTLPSWPIPGPAPNVTIRPCDFMLPSPTHDSIPGSPFELSLVQRSPTTFLVSWLLLPSHASHVYLLTVRQDIPSFQEPIIGAHSENIGESWVWEAKQKGYPEVQGLSQETCSCWAVLTLP